MQKKTLHITLTVLFLAFGLMLMSTSAIAPVPSETVDTNEPVYPYWKVGGTVVISGTGYNETHVYNVTVIYPGAVVTVPVREFTGLTAFTADYVISNVDPEGTYKVEVYDIDVNALVASCHFGIWGTDEASYQRTETVTVAGGGADAGSTVTVKFYNTTNDLIATKTPTADLGGEWSTSWAIPKDADLGTWTVEISGFEFDFPSSVFTSQKTFEVTAATLSVEIDTQPEDSYERTETASMTFWIQYPDESYYTASDLGSITVGVYRMVNDVQTLVYEFGLVAGDFDSGTNTWDASWNIPVCADLDVDYHFKILEDYIEDKVLPVPNKGPASDVASDYFEVVSAELSVVVTSDEDEYGGLSTVYFTAEIDYPNGTDFTTAFGGEAYANIWIDADGDNEVDGDEFTVVEDLGLTYDSGNVWDGNYLLYDPPDAPGAINGTYKIKVYAADDCDNSGEGEDLFDVIPETIKDPTHGPVGTEVDIWGSGFAPDTDVFVAWYMSITGDFVGVGDGETTEFPLTMMEFVVPGSEKIYVDGVLQTIDDYKINYDLGVINFTVPPPAGMLQAVVITADYDVMIMLAMPTTDEYGSFATTFTVPESYACEHEVWAIQTVGPETLYAIDIYCVEPQIVLSSTKGPPEAWITVTGTGFAPNSEVIIDAVLPYYFVEISRAVAKTDTYGTFAGAIMLPMTNLYYQLLEMLYNEEFPPIAPIGIEACDNDENWDFTFYLAYLWCQEDTIDVDVEVGELYFPGEVITVYALTSVDGVPTDVENIEFLAYRETLGPVPVSQFYPIVHVDTGLYAITTTLVDIVPGNYLFEVKASKSTYYLINEPGRVACIWWWEWNNTFAYWAAPEYWFEAWEELGYEYLIMEGYEATINGVGIEGFIVSPTLMGMNAMITEINGTIATVVVPGIRQIRLDLSAINATISELITTSKGEILAKIDTALGTIEAKLDAINATLTGLITDAKGEILAEIETKAGTILAKLDAINATIVGLVVDAKGEILTEISTAVGTITTTLSSINGTLTTIEGDVATIITDVGAIELKLDETVIPMLQAINATIVDLEKKIDGYYLALNTTIGEIVLKVDPGVFVYLEAIEAKLDFVNATTIRIESAIGDVEVKLDDIGDFLVDIKAEIVALKGDVATLNTTLGIIQIDISNINLRVTSIEGDIATISTTLGEITGRITTIEGDIATIETDIGEVQTALPPLQETSSATKSATTLGMSIGLVLSAFAAIAAVAACILILRRLKVAS